MELNVRMVLIIIIAVVYICTYIFEHYKPTTYNETPNLVSKYDTCDNNSVNKFMENNTFLLNGNYNERGQYCIPKDMIVCNPFTSIASYHNKMWNCLSNNRYFGGLYGTKIIGCNSQKIINYETNQVYNHYIPINENVNFTIQYNGKNKYSCYSEMDSKLSNIEEIEDYCSKYLSPINIKRKYLENDICNCTKPLDNARHGKLNTPCISCNEGIGDTGLRYKDWKQHSIKINRLCLKQDSIVQVIKYQNLMPCGIDTLSNNKTDYCETGYILASNGNSPMLQEYISIVY